MATKKIILERKQITLPKFVVTASSYDSSRELRTSNQTVVQDGKIIKFDNVTVEKALKDLRADIFATINETPLIIEVFYRHKVDNEKLEKIKNINISAIEIDLSDLKPENLIDWESFWSSINETKRINWLHNDKAENHVYPKLKNRLDKDILEHRDKEIRKIKPLLSQALNELKILSSKGRIEQYTQEAPTTSAWSAYGKSLFIPLDELPHYLNLDIPNSDWIFGCDRRIWQTTLYAYFIRLLNAQSISIRQTNDIIRDICNSPRSLTIVEEYCNRFPDLIPKEFCGRIPSSSETLKTYFNYLCELGILEFYGDDPENGAVYTVLNEHPICNGSF